MTEKPILPVTLVIVSDFEPGQKTWQDEDECLRHFMGDKYGGPSQVIIAASSTYNQTKRPDWSDISSPVKLVFVDSEYSGTIKDGGTKHATEDLLVVVEADCIPKPGCLAQLYAKYRVDKNVSAVTGLTIYEPTSSLRRVSSLYDRAYLEETENNGDAVHISNNGALYEKELLLKFPYEEHASPFITGHKRQIDMKKDGIRFGLNRQAILYHAFDGWPFLFDLRKNKGFQYQIMRSYMLGISANTTQKFSWTFIMFGEGIRSDFRTLWLSFKNFCKPRDLPLALIYPFIVRSFEIWGAVSSHTGHQFVPGSSYR